MQSQRDLIAKHLTQGETPNSTSPGGRVGFKIQGRTVRVRDLTQNGHVVRPADQTFTIVPGAKSVNILAALRTGLLLSKVESPVG